MKPSYETEVGNHTKISRRRTKQSIAMWDLDLLVSSSNVYHPKGVKHVLLGGIAPETTRLTEWVTVSTTRLNEGFNWWLAIPHFCWIMVNANHELKTCSAQMHRARHALQLRYRSCSEYKYKYIYIYILYIWKTWQIYSLCQRTTRDVFAYMSMFIFKIIWDHVHKHK